MCYSSVYRLYFTPDEVVETETFHTEDDDLLDDDDKNADGSDKEMEDAKQPAPNAENIFFSRTEC